MSDIKDSFIRVRDDRSDEEKFERCKALLDMWIIRTISSSVIRRGRFRDEAEDIFQTIVDKRGDFLAKPIYYVSNEETLPPSIVYEINPEVIDRMIALTFLHNLGILHTEDGEIKNSQNPREEIYNKLSEFPEGDLLQVEDLEGTYRLYTLVNFESLYDTPGYKEFVNG